MKKICIIMAVIFSFLALAACKERIDGAIAKLDNATNEIVAQYVTLDSITEDFTLPSKKNGVKIEWTSSDENTILIRQNETNPDLMDAIIYRNPSGADGLVELTAKLSINSEIKIAQLLTAEKVFNAKVKGYSNENVTLINVGDLKIKFLASEIDDEELYQVNSLTIVALTISGFVVQDTHGTMFVYGSTVNKSVGEQGFIIGYVDSLNNLPIFSLIKTANGVGASTWNKIATKVNVNAAAQDWNKYDYSSFYIGDNQVAGFDNQLTELKLDNKNYQLVKLGGKIVENNDDYYLYDEVTSNFIKLDTDSIIYSNLTQVVGKVGVLTGIANYLYKNDSTFTNLKDYPVWSVIITAAEIELTDEEKATLDSNSLTIQTSFNSNLNYILPSLGFNNSLITWESNNTSAVVNEGILVIEVTEGQTSFATLTASIKNGSVTKTKQFDLVILVRDIVTISELNGLQNESYITLQLDLIGYDGYRTYWGKDENSTITLSNVPETLKLANLVGRKISIDATKTTEGLIDFANPINLDIADYPVLQEEEEQLTADFINSLNTLDAGRLISLKNVQILNNATKSGDSIFNAKILGTSINLSLKYLGNAKPVLSASYDEKIRLLKKLMVLDLTGTLTYEEDQIVIVLGRSSKFNDVTPIDILVEVALNEVLDLIPSNEDGEYYSKESFLLPRSTSYGAIIVWRYDSELESNYIVTLYDGRINLPLTEVSLDVYLKFEISITLLVDEESETRTLLSDTIKITIDNTPLPVETPEAIEE